MAVVLAITRPAMADPNDADRRADEGKALAAQGKFHEAAVAFREGYAIEPRPQLICNVGISYYKANELPRAAYYLEKCREIGGQLDAAFLDNVDKVLAAVRQVLASGGFASITIAVEPPTAATTIVGGPYDEPIVGSRTVWVPPGTYTVKVRATGFRDFSDQLQAAEHGSLAIRTKLEPEPKIIVDDPHTSPAPPPPVPRPPPDSPSAWPALATSIGAAAAGVLAAIAFAHANTENDLAAKTTDHRTYQDLRANTLTYEHISWFAGGLAGASAIASGFLWYRAWHVEPTQSGAVISLAGKF